jgi:hypothetical protein
MSMKIPMTPSEIDLATFRLVAQYINHCTTACRLQNSGLRKSSSESWTRLTTNGSIKIQKLTFSLRLNELKIVSGDPVQSTHEFCSYLCASTRNQSYPNISLNQAKCWIWIVPDGGPKFLIWGIAVGLTDSHINVGQIHKIIYEKIVLYSDGFSRYSP